MGTMRNNFAGASVIIILMLSTSLSLPLDGYENSSKRNSLSNTLTLDPRSTSSSIYECLFIDPDLPLCDVKWMLGSEEDSTKDENLFARGVQRSRRNVDVSTKDVIVYTIEGCLPLRLPFSLPSCEGISLDRIVDIQRFHPFAVKGVTKPPFVFPEFNYPEWLRMMTRLRNHVSSKTREEEEHAIDSQKILINNSIQVHTDELINAAVMKETMPNAMAANMNISKGSSWKRFIPTSSSEWMELRSKEPSDRRKLNDYDQKFKEMKEFEEISDILDIPTIPMEGDTYDNPMALKYSNKFSTKDNSNNFPFDSDSKVREADNGIENDFLPLDISLETYRRRRAVNFPVLHQQIPQDPKERGIAGKSSSPRFSKIEEHINSNIKRWPTSEMQNNIEASNSKERIAAIPHHSAEPSIAIENNDSRGKIDAIEDTDASWRQSLLKETMSRKKYKNRIKLHPSRIH